MKKKRPGGLLGMKIQHEVKKRNLFIAIVAIFFAMILFSAKETYEVKGHIQYNQAGFGVLSVIGIGCMMLSPDPEPSGGGNKSEQEKLLQTIKDTVNEIIEKREDLKYKEVEKLQKVIEKMEKQLEAAGADKMETITKELERLANDITAMKEKPVEEKQYRSFDEALKAAYEEKKEEIDAIVKANGRQSGPLRLTIKLPVTMMNENTIEAVGSASHYSLTSNTGIISTLRKRILVYLQNVATGGLSIDRPYAMWIEELDEQGTPIFIGEGDDKTQLSVRYEEREKKAKKIAVYGKVSTEMLRYLPQLTSYINNNLLKRMDIVTEDQLFNGDDTGDNLAGILGYATAFDGGVGEAGGAGLVGLVQEPNEYDVLRALALQVQNSYGLAGAVFVTPDTLAKMDVDKDNEGRYILPPFKTADGTVVAGVRLIATTALIGTDYDFVGGDLSVVNVQFLFQMGITVGLDGNDFTKNKKTILAEQELVQFVSANDTQVLVKGDFETAKALLLEV